mmetsp:Transcript_77860/g.152374  ORF Transcript_77860/g.152374 Transcript_77860/m.152374 type:complete len:142 (-) Transcript_77860:145-570(-)
MSDGAVSKINAFNNAVEATVNTGGSTYGLASDGSFIWVATGSDVAKINSETNVVVAFVGFFECYGGVAFDGTYIWVATGETFLGSNVVRKINPETNAVVATVSTCAADFCSPFGVASAGTYIWVTNRLQVGLGTVTKIGPN